MKKILHISTSVDNEQLVESMVEELASQIKGDAIIKTLVSNNWEAIQTSSTETFISGTALVTEGDDETIHMPFTTPFIFTCLKASNSQYKLHWSMSCN